MKFEELKEMLRTRRLRSLPININSLKESDWHQHPVPEGYQGLWGKLGGWVQNSASVDPSALIDDSSVVLGNATVGAHARLLESSVIKDRAQLGENAVAFHRSTIEGTARIFPNAIVGLCHFIGDAKVNFNFVYGGETDWNHFYKRHSKSHILQGVFFRDSYAGETQTVRMKRNKAIEDYRKICAEFTPGRGKHLPRDPGWARL
jgi:NDP-sugar pyrophosphorylase family protein